MSAPNSRKANDDEDVDENLEHILQSKQYLPNHEGDDDEEAAVNTFNMHHARSTSSSGFGSSSDVSPAITGMNSPRTEMPLLQLPSAQCSPVFGPTLLQRSNAFRSTPSSMSSIDGFSDTAAEGKAARDDGDAPVSGGPQSKSPVERHRDRQTTGSSNVAANSAQENASAGATGIGAPQSLSAHDRQRTGASSEYDSDGASRSRSLAATFDGLPDIVNRLVGLSSSGGPASTRTTFAVLLTCFFFYAGNSGPCVNPAICIAHLVTALACMIALAWFFAVTPRRPSGNAPDSKEAKESHRTAVERNALLLFCASLVILVANTVAQCLLHAHIPPALVIHA